MQPEDGARPDDRYQHRKAQRKGDDVPIDRHVDEHADQQDDAARNGQDDAGERPRQPFKGIALRFLVNPQYRQHQEHRQRQRDGDQGKGNTRRIEGDTVFPAVDGVKAVGRKAVGDVPVEYWGLHDDADGGGQIGLGPGKERSKFRIDEDEAQKGHPEEQRIVFGENAKAEQERGKIEPGKAGLSGLPAIGEGEEEVARKQAQHHQQVIVEADRGENEQQRRAEIKRQRRPEPGSGIVGREALRKQPERPHGAGEGDPGEGPEAKKVPAEQHRHQPQ